MKRIIPVAMLSAIVAFSACGNKTANNETQQDTVQAADTTTTDTIATAEPEEAAPEAKDAPAAKTSLTPYRRIWIRTSHSRSPSSSRRQR